MTQQREDCLNRVLVLVTGHDGQVGSVFSSRAVGHGFDPRSSQTEAFQNW